MKRRTDIPSEKDFCQVKKELLHFFLVNWRFTVQELVLKFDQPPGMFVFQVQGLILSINNFKDEILSGLLGGSKDENLEIILEFVLIFFSLRWQACNL